MKVYFVLLLLFIILGIILVYYLLPLLVEDPEIQEIPLKQYTGRVKI